MGRRVFGLAAILLGVAGLVLQHQLTSSWRLPGAPVFLVVTDAAQVIGGACLQMRRTERFGALILLVVYLVFSLTFIPAIVAQPGVYYTWGDVFYQLALVAGAMGAYGIRKGGTVLLGLCCASFAIEQIEFLARTSSLVPKWMPGGGLFWTIATTIAFGLAAIALVSGYRSLLAARLLTAMMSIFTIAVWVPILIADPYTLSNWSEGLETFATAGAAWIIAECNAVTSKH